MNTHKDKGEDKIKIICCQKGCPRTVTVDKLDTDPIKAVTMKIYCPWHERAGEFDDPIYFDKNGNQVGIEIEDYKKEII